MIRLALAVALVAGLVAAPAASAHGGPCRALAQEPRVEQDSIIGNGRVNCAADHSHLRLRVCLQRRVNGNWDSRDCRNFDRSGVTGVQAETAKFCHEGLWRTRAKGVAVNQDGEVVHRAFDKSPEVRIRNC